MSRGPLTALHPLSSPSTHCFSPGWEVQHNSYCRELWHQHRVLWCCEYSRHALFLRSMGWDLPLLCCFPCLPGCTASWAPAGPGGEISRVLAPLFLFVIISSNDTAGSGVLSTAGACLMRAGCLCWPWEGASLGHCWLVCSSCLSQRESTSSLCFSPDSKGTQCPAPAQMWHLAISPLQSTSVALPFQQGNGEPGLPHLPPLSSQTCSSQSLRWL